MKTAKKVPHPLCRVAALLATAPFVGCETLRDCRRQAARRVVAPLREPAGEALQWCLRDLARRDFSGRVVFRGCFRYARVGLRGAVDADESTGIHDGKVAKRVDR